MLKTTLRRYWCVISFYLDFAPIFSSTTAKWLPLQDVCPADLNDLDASSCRPKESGYHLFMRLMVQGDLRQFGLYEDNQAGIPSHLTISRQQRL